MSAYVMFHADPSLVKSSGDNSGFIYEASTVFHVGESFELKANDELVVIPCRPKDGGPWKQYRTIVKDGQGILCKEITLMSILVQNRWPRKSVKVFKGMSLATLMHTWGISHEMSFTTEDQLVCMQEVPSVVEDEEKKLSIRFTITNRRRC